MTDIDPTVEPSPRYAVRIPESRVVEDPVLVCEACGCIVHPDFLPRHDQWHEEQQ